MAPIIKVPTLRPILKDWAIPAMRNLVVYIVKKPLREAFWKQV